MSDADRIVLPKIKVAELCFGLGWAAGYESALKGAKGPSLDEAWRDSAAAILQEHPDLASDVNRGAD